MNLNLILDKLSNRRKLDPSADGYQELLELCSCALGEAMRLQREEGASIAKMDKQAGQLMLIRELVYGPPRKSAPDAWQALRNILEQAEPTPPQLVLNIRDAVTRSASLIEQAGRVRWLLQQEKPL